MRPSRPLFTALLLAVLLAAATHGGGCQPEKTLPGKMAPRSKISLLPETVVVSTTNENNAAPQGTAPPKKGGRQEQDEETGKGIANVRRLGRRQKIVVVPSSATKKIPSMATNVEQSDGETTAQKMPPQQKKVTPSTMSDIDAEEEEDEEKNKSDGEEKNKEKKSNNAINPSGGDVGSGDGNSKSSGGDVVGGGDSAVEDVPAVNGASDSTITSSPHLVGTNGHVLQAEDQVVTHAASDSSSWLEEKAANNAYIKSILSKFDQNKHVVGLPEGKTLGQFMDDEWPSDNLPSAEALSTLVAVLRQLPAPVEEVD